MSDNNIGDPPRTFERVEPRDFTPLELVPKGVGCLAEAGAQLIFFVVSVTIGGLSLKLAGFDLGKMDPDLVVLIGGVIVLIGLLLAVLIHKLFASKRLASQPTTKELV